MGRLPGSWDPPAWGGPWVELLLAASVLSSCLQLAPAQTILITPQSPAEGGDVSLALENPPQDFVSCNWYRSATTEESRRILTYYPSTPLIPNQGPAHTGRETAGPGCALNIAGLTLSDTGNYTLQMDSPPNRILASVNLRISASVLSSCLQLAPAQTIRITPPSPVVEGDVSLALENPPQDFLSCSWYRSATAEETRRILTYYPSTPLIPNQGPAHTGRETAGPGYALKISGLTLNDTGSYALMMDSPPNRILASVNLRVSEMLPQPTVTPNQTQVLENGTFTLTCNSSPGTNTLLWLQNGSDLATDQRLQLSPDNRTLTVLNVSRGDAGAYQCKVRNPVSTNHSEPSTVTVAYGPDSARIDPQGPITHPLGSPLTLTCVSDSVPPSRYRWFHNGTDANEAWSSWTFNLTSWAQQGTFACQAHNPDTNLTARASVTVWVVASPAAAPGTSLSAGAIAGIVIGSLAGVALVGGLVYFLLRKPGGGPEQRTPVRGPAAPTHNQGVGDDKPPLGKEDIQYSTLAFTSGAQKPPPGPQPLAAGGTVYSEIRKK